MRVGADTFWNVVSLSGIEVHSSDTRALPGNTVASTKFTLLRQRARMGSQVRAIDLDHTPAVAFPGPDTIISHEYRYQ
ncbi:hypothetical protein Ntsu_07660 [Nocardia sp. IFM 10818]